MKSLIVAVAGLSLALVPGSAFADTHNITIRPNQVVTFTGSGCPANSDQSALIGAVHASGGVLGHFRSDAAGRFDVRFAVPWEGETHATANLCGNLWRITYDSAPASQLPFTGAATARIGALGALALMAGACLSLVKRKRGERAPTSVR